MRASMTSFPDSSRARPQRYAGLRLRDLCAARCTPSSRLRRQRALQRAQFAPEHLPEPAMAPQEAVRQMVRNNVDYLPLDKLAGRIATTLFVVYPPGIATIVPGERLGERAAPMLEYLKMFERSANLFPGFEAEIQGVYREIEPDGTIGSTPMWCANSAAGGHWIFFGALAQPAPRRRFASLPGARRRRRQAGAAAALCRSTARI